jgi:hypothetical protein
VPFPTPWVEEWSAHPVRPGNVGAAELRDAGWRSILWHVIIAHVIGDRWGVTDDEVALQFPCDDWVRTPTMEAWRAVWVHTWADELWPWITQVRLAPYSYDCIDNLGRRSPQSLRNLAEPTAGENFTCAAGLRLGKILSVTPQRQLTGRIGGTVISYVLVEQPFDEPCTRLLMKVVTDMTRLLAPPLCIGDLVMARRQLLNFKRLAESATVVESHG